MNVQDKDSEFVVITESLSHLYLGLTRYLDWIHENPKQSEETAQQTKRLIQTSRDGLETYLSKNPVVQRSVEEECAFVFSIVEQATHGGLTPKLIEKMTIERAKLQTKIVALTDLVALFKAL